MCLLQERLVCLCVMKYKKAMPGEANIQDQFLAACKEGRLETVTALLADDRVNPAACGVNPLHYACYHDDVAVVKALLSDGRVDPRGAMWLANFRGNTDMVEALLADGRADPRSNDSESIRIASERNSVQKVRALLADGRANPRANNNEAIRWASFRGNVEMVRALLADGRAALRVAIHTGRDCDETDVVRACVSGRGAWFACAK